MLAFFANIGPWQLIAILVIALLLFGNRLPEVARSIGRAMNEFKRGLKDVKDDFDDATADNDKHSDDPPREFNAPQDQTYPREAAGSQSEPVREQSNDKK